MKDGKFLKGLALIGIGWVACKNQEKIKTAAIGAYLWAKSKLQSKKQDE